jgi:integrase
MGVSTYRTKDGRQYKAVLYVDGVAVASKRGFATKAKARDWMKEEKERLKQPALEAQTGTAFSAVASSYLADMEVRRQLNTFKYKQAIIQRFIAHMQGDFVLEDLTIADIDAYLLARHSEDGPKTANRHLVELKAVLNWAVRKNLFQSNPFREIEPYPEQKFQRYVPPAEDVAAVRAVAEGQERDLLDVLFYTGARLSEACRLTYQDIDFGRLTITLWTRKRRGGSMEPRTMGMVRPLADRLHSLFTNRESNHVFTDPATGNPLTKNTRWCITLFDKLCKRAEVKRFTAHCIRHFVATRLKDSRQATPFQIQNFLGHQNLSTTEKYLHELDIDRDVSAILDDSKITVSDKIEPQIEPQTPMQ